jgi:hypothetical protein
VTLTRAIDDLARAGFGEHFGVDDDALRSFTSGRRYRAAEVVIREFHRFEGVSDPDDMCIVYAIEAQGGARGTLVDAFGVYSDPMVSAFLQKVPIRGARRFGGGLDERPWEFGPPGEIRERKRRIPEPARFGAYRHGVPLPVPSDPWQDEGGESGPGQ